MGAAAALAAAVLPGMWVPFLWPRGRLPWGVRLALGVVLAPAALAGEFYALRLTGLSFPAAARALPLLNLPVLALLAWRLRTDPPRAPGALAAHVWVWLVTLGGLLPRLLRPADRALSGHAWMHTDICYRLAAGDLVPEDPLLGGVRLAYFWTGHVYQAVVSWLADACPATSYVWTNLLFLGATAALVAAAARVRGAPPREGAAAVALLFFGLNFVGHVVARLLPLELPGLGDPRYTPWLLKIPFFSQMPAALGALAGVLYLRVAPPRTGGAALPYVWLAALLLLYPLLFPAGALLAGITWLSRRRPGTPPLLGEALLLAGLALAGWGYVRWVTAARTTGEIFLSAPTALLRKGADAAVALGPLLHFAWRGRRRAPAALPAAVVLAAGYVLLHLPYWRNEYKLLFPAALFLAPPAAAGLGRVLGARRGGLLFAVGTALLAFPLYDKTYRYPRWGRPLGHPLDTLHFALRLGPGSPLAAPCERIRTATPPSALLVAPRWEVHLPTVTGRSYYVPPPEPAAPPPPPHRPPFGTGPPGLNLAYPYLLLRVRGYPPALVAARWRTVRRLYRGRGGERARALTRLRAGGRPLVIWCARTDGALARWLAARPGVRELRVRGSARLFLVSPTP